MSRKHYIAIARALHNARITGAPNMTTDAQAFMNGAEEQAGYFIDAIAEVLKQDNPAFDRARFLEACKVIA